MTDADETLFGYLGGANHKQARCWRFITRRAMLVWLASWTLGFAYMPELELPGRTTYSGSVSAATLPLNGDFSGAGTQKFKGDKVKKPTSQGFIDKPA